MLRALALVLIFSSSMPAGAFTVPEPGPVVEPQPAWVEVVAANLQALSDPILDLASGQTPSATCNLCRLRRSAAGSASKPWTRCRYRW